MHRQHDTPMTGPTRSQPARSLLVVPILLAALSACGGDDADGATRQDVDATGALSGLPAPEGAVGSVTGMPENPGPGTVPLAGKGSGAAAAASPATGTGTGTGAVPGTDQDEIAAVDDGGLDRMAVETDFPDPASTGEGTPSTPSPHAPPIVIVSEPPGTAPTATDPPAPTEVVPQHDDH